MDISVGVGYDDDLKRAQQILLDIARNNSLILDDPAPFVQVVSLGDSSISLTLFAYAKNGDFGDAKSQVTEAIRNDIIGNGLNIPYPQRDLHVYHHNADGTPLTEIITRSVTDDGDVKAKPAE
jgi:small-conductance mechanosensitive channel